MPFDRKLAGRPPGRPLRISWRAIRIQAFSGNTVRPRLYFAIGVSGSSQHPIGMRTAGTIVAINGDHEAPIFEVADCNVFGDLYDIVPRPASAIRKSRSRDRANDAICSRTFVTEQ